MLMAAISCQNSVPIVKIGDVSLEVEVSETLEEHINGLSGRENLSDMSGMLFVFEAEGSWPMWMRGMKIPLDFIWISDECMIVDAVTAVVPPDSGIPESQLITYESTFPAAYILEVNGGQMENLGIQIGDKVRFLSLIHI